MTRLALVGGVLVILACQSKSESPPPGASTPPPEAKPAKSPDAIQGSGGEPACRAAASQERPTVRWAADTALRADLNYDGAPDAVFWGPEGDSLFVVGIVECVPGRAGRVWLFPIPARKVFGTTNLEISVVNPAFGQGYFAENCLGAETTADCRHLGELNTRLQSAYDRGGRGLQIGVPDIDNYHLYWDAAGNQFVTWRP